MRSRPSPSAFLGRSLMNDKLDKLQCANEFLLNRLWFHDFGPNLRLTGCSIKVTPTGYLYVLKAISPEGPIVAFSSEQGIDGLRRKLESGDGPSSLKWRPDKFRLDNFR